MKVVVVIALLATVTTLQAYHTNLQDTEDKECKKDILLMLDMSSSIGKSTFENQVKKFVKGVIESPLLDVGPDGTHMSVIVFSETDKTTGSRKVKDKTKLLFDFGRYLSQRDLVKQIDNLDWATQGGGSYTETAYALELANKAVFKERNPNNWRKGIADVVILFTDGAPRPKKYTDNKIKDALDEANKLKKKKVQIVTIATGKEGEIDTKMAAFLKEAASSPEDSFIASFDNLDSIIEKLVGASCRTYNQGDCGCADVSSAVRYIPASQGTLKVRWPEPGLQCDISIRYKNKIITPNYQSPHSFPPGSHVIAYKYVFRGGVSTSCNVYIPIKSCECPSVAQSVHYIANDDAKASVLLTVPKLACRPSLQSSNDVPSPRRFGVGKHKVTYKYEIEAGTFLSCDVDVEVKGVPCQGKNYDPSSQVCCCGKVHKKKKNGTCCGLGYYDTTKEKCCPFNWNLVALNGECPESNI